MVGAGQSRTRAQHLGRRNLRVHLAGRPDLLLREGPGGTHDLVHGARESRRPVVGSAEAPGGREHARVEQFLRDAFRRPPRPLFHQRPGRRLRGHGHVGLVPSRHARQLRLGCARQPRMPGQQPAGGVPGLPLPERGRCRLHLFQQHPLGGDRPGRLVGHLREPQASRRHVRFARCRRRAQLGGQRIASERARAGWAGDLLRLEPARRRRRSGPLDVDAGEHLRPMVGAGKPGRRPEQLGHGPAPVALVGRHGSLLPLESSRRLRRCRPLGDDAHEWPGSSSRRPRTSPA